MSSLSLNPSPPVVLFVYLPYGGAVPRYPDLARPSTRSNYLHEHPRNRSDLSASWSFETKQIDAGQTPDKAARMRAPCRCPRPRPTPSTTPNTPPRCSGWLSSGQHLHPDHEPDPRTRSSSASPRSRVVSPRCSWPPVQAAETFAILNIAGAGDHIVSSPRLYGGTYNLLHYTLPKLGIETTFVEDPDDLDTWQKAVRPNTKAFFAETISNPQIDILDIPGVAKVAHDNGVPLIVDNTIATPYLIQPIAHGADIVVHSATKYLGGHGTAIAGVIVDSGNFDWTSGRFPGFTTPDPSYHGVVFADLGAPGVRPQGPCSTPARPGVRRPRRSTPSWWPRDWRR